MVVRELFVRLGFQLNQGQINKAEQATSRIKDRANDAAQSVRNIAAAFISIASVKSIVKIVDDMQSLRARIGLLPQTIGDVGAAFDEVADHAIASRQGLHAYMSVYTRIGNAAKEYIKTQQDLLSVTDTISQALVVGGATATEQSSAFLQFSQALGAGTLQGEEFRAMAEAAPQYMDMLAQELDVPRESLKKLASEGKITTKQVIEATKRMADYFNWKFKQIPMTIEQSMGIVVSKFSRGVDRMNRETKIVDKISDTILKSFEKIEESVTSLVDKFGGWNNAIRFVGIAIGVAFGAKAIAMISAIGVAQWKAFLVWNLIALVLISIALIIEDVYVWLQGGDSLTGRILEKFKQWGSAIEDGFSKTESYVLETLVGWSNALYNVFFETIPRAVRDAWESIKNMPMEIWAGIKSVASSTGNGFEKGLSSITPSSIARGNIAAPVSNTTNVTVTVPPGTSQEQATFLQKAAQTSFADMNKPLKSMDMATYSD